MTKTYKINGREVSGISKWDKETLGVQETITEMCQRDLELKATITAILEALSDKEEHIHTKECMEGVENAVNNLKSVTNCAVCTGKLKEDVCFHCGGTGLHVYEEECKHDNEFIKDGECMACLGEKVRSKQSISLKEEIRGKVLRYAIEDCDSDNAGLVADKILKLIQSHLVKEIESLPKSKLIQKAGDYYACGYGDSRQDIIKIIKGLC